MALSLPLGPASAVETRNAVAKVGDIWPAPAARPGRRNNPLPALSGKPLRLKPSVVTVSSPEAFGHDRAEVSMDLRA